MAEMLKSLVLSNPWENLVSSIFYSGKKIVIKLLLLFGEHWKNKATMLQTLICVP